MQVKLFSLVNFETRAASMRTAFYMQHLINNSTVSTKQNNTLGVAQQTTYKKTCFLRHDSSQIEDWVLVAFLTSEKSCVLEMPFWMCLCIKNIHLSVLIKRAAIIYLCLTETTVFFIEAISFFKKTWLSAYWRP